MAPVFFQSVVMASTVVTSLLVQVLLPFLPCTHPSHPPSPGGLVEFAADLQSFLIDLSHIIHVCEEGEAAVCQPIPVPLQVLGPGTVVKCLKVLELKEIFSRDTAADALASGAILLQI
jgi:hypothetical protein